MSLVQMSFSGAVMIIAILLVRAIGINRLPKMVFVVLWEVAFLRLLIPISIPSVFSAYSIIREIPEVQEVRFAETAVIPEVQEVQSAAAAVISETREMQSAETAVIPEMQEIPSAVSANLTEMAQHEIPAVLAEVALPLGTIFWIAGMAMCALFFLISYLRCYREFKMSLPVGNAFAEEWLKGHRIKRGIRIRQSDRISSPLTYGIFRPVILMPKTTDWEDTQRLQYVLKHEYIHIRRFDMVRKFAAALVLCIHWFNPAVWMMYVMYNRDIELSCDESVIRKFGESSKSVYAEALIAMEEKRNNLQPLSNSFSKNAIEERIRAVMKTKKVTVWAVIISMAVVAVIIVVFATSANSVENDTQDNTDAANGESDNADAVMASGNEAGDAVGSNENDNGGILREGEMIELPNGLYACLKRGNAGDIEIDGVTEWIQIRETNPETGAGNDSIVSDDLMPGSTIQIPNVYGNIRDIRMHDYSEIYVCYQDEDGYNEQITIPMDFYCSKGNAVEPPDGWTSNRTLVYNVEELTNKTTLPEEVWSETFVSDGKEYRAVYSRISPMYGADYWEASYLYADYQFEIRQDEEVMYEVKLYQMSVEYEEVYCIEDINGDGIDDFMQINAHDGLSVYWIPYIFVWDKETETCIYGGPAATEEKTLYELPSGGYFPVYAYARYDRDNRTLYDVSNILAHDWFDHDIYDRIIVCGAKFIDGEWKTVYELYLGEEGEDYARETKYDENGNIISEITCTEEEHYDLVGNLYDECELNLYDNFYGNGWEPEEIVVNEQFSYSKYVRNEE